MEALPEDLIVEILSWLPPPSLCRCLCVSRSWRVLIGHPAHRGRLAQTLAGFFFRVHTVFRSPSRWDFAGLTSTWAGLPLVDPDFKFLPPSYSRRSIEMLDSCNGLLLLRCVVSQQPGSARPFYVVCNPTTKEWVRLPEPSRAAGSSRTRYAALAFDPAVSPHFHVFQLVEAVEDTLYGFVEEVEIYLSETGRWARRASGWNDVVYTGRFAYLNGFLHLATYNGEVASVDTVGQAWRVTCVRPARQARTAVMAAFRARDFHGFVGRSQGRLLYVIGDAGDAGGLSVYVLEDHGGQGQAWTLQLKQISASDITGPRSRPFGGVVAIHPDGNTIFFFDGAKRVLRAYDMDHRVVRVVRDLTEASRGSPCLPYVPLYSKGLLATQI